MSTRTPARSAAARGATNRRKGHQAERDTARYLRHHGFSRAERKPDNGWRARDRTTADHGDITGTPGLAWQIKNRADMTDTQIAAALADTEAQRVAAGADYGILVQRRAGKADPGRWWAWCAAAALCELASGHPACHAARFPVRMALADIVRLLRVAGYGDPGE